MEENDIFGNRRAGVAILKEGEPLVKRNRIHNGRDSGVLVCANGKGSVVDNDIFANQMAGVAIGRGGASRITGNVIRDGNGGSLCLSAHSRGLISANVIHQDPRAAMQVPDMLLPDVKENNFIRWSDDPEGLKDAMRSRTGHFEGIGDHSGSTIEASSEDRGGRVAQEGGHDGGAYWAAVDTRGGEHARAQTPSRQERRHFGRSGLDDGDSFDASLGLVQ